MRNGARYVVTTHWGTFSLDEGAYQDYLAGKLWISWTPGKQEITQQNRDMHLPANITDRATYRNYEAQKQFFVFSYDELLDEGMDEPEDTISVEDLALDRLFVFNLKKAMCTSSPWASELIDLYLSERSSEVQKYLIDKYGISRTTAYRHQITFEYRLKKFLKINETK